MEWTTLEKIICRLNTLPTISPIYERVCQMVEDPDVSVSELSRAISEDQTLTARLLRMVNSAFYGFPERISTVTRAVSILGFEPLKNLVLATSVMSLFDARDGNGASQEICPLWRHSLGCAVATRAIAKQIGRNNPEEFFVAGLLHDIGKVVMLLVFPEEVKHISHLVREKGIDFLEAEHEVIGVDHPQIGRILSNHWNLPPRLVESIAVHHSPNMAQHDSQQAGAVHVGDILARALHLGTDAEERIPPFNRSAWGALKLPLERLEPTMAETQTDYYRALSLLRPAHQP